MIQIHMGSRPTSLLRDFRLDGFVYLEQDHNVTHRLGLCGDNPGLHFADLPGERQIPLYAFRETIVPVEGYVADFRGGDVRRNDLEAALLAMEGLCVHRLAFYFSMSEDRLGETADRLRTCVRDIADLLTLRPYRFRDVYVMCNTCALHEVEGEMFDVVQTRGAGIVNYNRGEFGAEVVDGCRISFERMSPGVVAITKVEPVWNGGREAISPILEIPETVNGRRVGEIRSTAFESDLEFDWGEPWTDAVREIRIPRRVRIVNRRKLEETFPEPDVVTIL